MEGHFETQRGAPLILFGLPDMQAETTRYALSVPKLGSLILTHDPDGEVRGLTHWPPEDRPYSPVVFWSFRAMVGIGLLMAACGAVSLWLRWRRRLYDSAWFHRAALALGPAGLLAVLAGWITTEVGRQPWVVHGLLRTAEATSPIAGPAVAGSLLAFVAVYLTVFGIGIGYMLRLIGRPPGEAAAAGDGAGTPLMPALAGWFDRSAVG
jgi:cytochrome d ubiquinol oxidase subunit I